MPEVKLDYKRIADFLTEGRPLAYAMRFDGSLSVVAANGQKFIFMPGEIYQAAQDLQTLDDNRKKAAKAPRKGTTAKKTG